MANTDKNKLLEKLISNSKEFPDDFFIHVEGEDLTYKELISKIYSMVTFFRKHQVVAGSKVAIYTDDDLFMITSLFALWWLKAIIIPINIEQTSEKIKSVEKGVLPHFGFYSKNYRIDYDRPFPLAELSLQLPVSQLTFEPGEDEEVAMILFTSGTSGTPKGVPMTHHCLYLNASRTGEFLNLSDKDRQLINTPTYTTSSLSYIFTALISGSSIVIKQGVMFGENIIEQMNKHNCTCFGGVPIHFIRIITALKKGNTFNNLRLLMNSGEHLPVPILKELIKLLPHSKIFCVYGLTEVAGRYCILDYKLLKNKYGSVGKPLPGMSLKVLDKNGNKTKSFELGEIYASGDCLMQCYVNKPEPTKEELLEKGFATGDIGYLDDDDFLFLKGRKDDVFKVGGEKVSSKVIEEAIHEYDHFKEFMIVSESYEHMGNVPVLYYVLKDNNEFEKTEIIKYLRKKLPPNHIPLKFHEEKELARTSSGKLIRKRIHLDKINE